MTIDRNPPRSALGPDEVRSVSPALGHYTDEKIENGLWLRPGLSRKDRHIVTAAALIANGQSIGMLHYFSRALDEGMRPGEMSEIVTHLAFYAGWPNAFAAVAILKDIFAQRDIGEEQLPEIAPVLLRLEDAVPDEDIRSAFLDEHIGHVAPALRRDTVELLYREVWLRPGLAPRDRDLATISALMASGQNEFLAFYIVGALKKGVTRGQISEIISHLAFYAGWGRAISAAGVVRQLFAPRDAGT